MAAFLIRRLIGALEPHSLDQVYINAINETTDDVVRAAYGKAKYDRLVEIKRTYDPTNLFRRNANINPAAGVPEPRVGGLHTPAATTAGGD